jgi:hypothetical protein
MAKYTLAKTIEARRVNPRTRIPTTDLPVTIPYGAILENLAQDGDVDNFTYLGQPYQCAHELVRAALEAQAAAAAPPRAEVEKPTLRWESLATTHGNVARARVPGGWLVASGGGGITFVPDPAHAWDGGSV